MGSFGAKERSHIIANVTLRQDLGEFKDSNDVRYNLDKDTSDRLLGHAREDASFAACLASDLCDQVRILKKIAIFQSALLLIVLLILVF